MSSLQSCGLPVGGVKSGNSRIILWYASAAISSAFAINRLYASPFLLSVDVGVSSVIVSSYTWAIWCDPTCNTFWFLITWPAISLAWRKTSLVSISSPPTNICVVPGTNWWTPAVASLAGPTLIVIVVPATDLMEGS